MVAFFFPLSLGQPAPTVTYRDNASSSVLQSSYTFSGLSIGPTGSNRLVVVAVGWTNSTGIARTVSSATIGGVSATIQCQINDAASTAPGVAVLSAFVPTGTTATVVVNFSGNNRNCIVATYSAYNVASGTATDTDTSISGVIAGTSGSTSVTSTVSTDGFIVASGLASSFDTTTITFSAGVSEDFELAQGTIRANAGSASGQTSGNKTVTVSGTNSVSGGWGLFLAAASFR